MQALWLGIAIAITSAIPACAAAKCGDRDVKQILTEQEFSGALDDQVTLKLLGRWGGNGYMAYWYEHVDSTRRAGHAVRSVVVLDAACRYLGRYAVSPSQPRLRGQVIYFTDTSASDGNQIRLTPNGPPPQALIDGELVGFWK